MAATVRFVAGPGALSAAHADAVIDLQRTCFGEVLRGRKALQRYHVWLAYLDGEAVGFGTLWPWTGADAGFLSLAGILPSARGLGLHRRLIHARVAGARRLGLPRAITYTARENLASANNLIRCGFSLYLPGELYGFANAYYFQRSLT